MMKLRRLPGLKQASNAATSSGAPRKPSINTTGAPAVGRKHKNTVGRVEFSQPRNVEPGCVSARRWVAETPSALTTPTYDVNGNMTGDETGHTLIYDAWNRLVQVKNGPTVLETYSYDALGRRVTENPWTLRDLYYDRAWQLLEEDVAGSMADQYVWSPVYIDALIERDTPTQRMYVQQDANFNVTALVDTSGTVQERYINDPFGSFTVLAANWTTRGTSNYGWVFFFQGKRYDFATGLFAY